MVLCKLRYIHLSKWEQLSNWSTWRLRSDDQELLSAIYLPTDWLTPLPTGFWENDCYFKFTLIDFKRYNLC